MSNLPTFLVSGATDILLSLMLAALVLFSNLAVYFLNVSEHVHFSLYGKQKRRRTAFVLIGQLFSSSSRAPVWIWMPEIGCLRIQTNDYKKLHRVFLWNAQLVDWIGFFPLPSLLLSAQKTWCTLGSLIFLLSTSADFETGLFAKIFLISFIYFQILMKLT